MTDTQTPIDVVIVGGGQAGISLSYYLQQHQIPHVVLERDRAFSSWHKRWDGFYANTPNWMNTLPMLPPDLYVGNDPTGFGTREQIVDYFEKCLTQVNPPIRLNTEVLKIVQLENGGWQTHTHDTVYESKHVAICTGAMSAPRVPRAAATLPVSVQQIHSSAYVNPDQITTKSVLLVGSGSSGVQICKLLGDSNKFEQIHLAVSSVLVLPKQLLGIQIHKFLHFFGLFDVRVDSLVGKLMYSGLETRGDPIVYPTPKTLERDYGVRLHGRFSKAEGDVLYFEDGDTIAADDLTIIWCTGFTGDFSFIQLRQDQDVFDSMGYPLHTRGVVKGVPGLYFVGLRYQYTAASHDIYGVGNDAKYVAEQIVSQPVSMPVASHS